MGPHKLDVGVMRRMGDRLTLLVACAHRTLNCNQAIRREFYPDIAEVGR